MEESQVQKTNKQTNKKAKRTEQTNKKAKRTEQLGSMVIPFRSYCRRTSARCVGLKNFAGFDTETELFHN